MAVISRGSDRFSMGDVSVGFLPIEVSTPARLYVPGSVILKGMNRWRIPGGPTPIDFSSFNKPDEEWQWQRGDYVGRKFVKEFQSTRGRRELFMS